jgi:ribosomal protein L37AE/L43A
MIPDWAIEYEEECYKKGICPACGRPISLSTIIKYKMAICSTCGYTAERK